MADTKISHEEFALLINEIKNYHKLKENVREKNNQRGDIKNKLIKYDKKCDLQIFRFMKA